MTGSRSLRTIGVGVTVEERELLQEAARSFGLNTSDFMRYIVFGAMVRGNSEYLLQTGIKSRRGQPRRRGVAGTQGWKVTGDMEKRRGPWVLAKPVHRSVNKSNPDKSNWWVLTNDNDPGFSKTTAFRADDALRIAMEYVIDYEEGHHEPVSTNGRRSRNSHSKNVPGKAKPGKRQPVEQSG